MDSDDEITPDCIATLYKAMQETPVDFVAASYKGIAFDKTLISHYNAPPYPDLLITEGDNAVAKAVYLQKKKIPGCTWNKLYRVDFLRKNEIRCIPHHSFMEDTFFTFQVILKARSCRILSAITLLYYQRMGSTVAVYDGNAIPRRAIETYMEIAQLMRGYLPQYQGSGFYSRLALTVYSNAMCAAVLMYKSAEFARADKKREIAQLLKYPMRLREVLSVSQNYYHLPLYLISRVSNTDVKIFLVILLRGVRRLLLVMRNFLT
jgi:hypothetical protein